MATKNEPGKFDCYGAANSDEPLFVLRSTDPVAPDLVRIWALLRSKHFNTAYAVLANAIQISSARESKMDPKFHEAMRCADMMEAWESGNPSE